LAGLEGRLNMDPDLYIEEVPTQGGGYNRCVICGGSDHGGGVQHVEACTPEFRQSVAETVGYV
jgi:hypothetical protein